ncbi:hypothetical protein, partial [Nocardia cyriacigeorgica]|uniref:hypothetical protein n=1 Tax=Nocardia cyriacigeorgica TaxID=135487 RepID=UPI0024580081
GGAGDLERSGQPAGRARAGQVNRLIRGRWDVLGKGSVRRGPPPPPLPPAAAPAAAGGGGRAPPPPPPPPPPSHVVGVISLLVL